MVSSISLFLLASAAAAAAPATVRTAAPTAPAAVRATATVDVLVTDRLGKPLSSAHVVVDGMAEREGDTNAAGHVVFKNMKAGAYRLQVERDRFITFEKEFTVRSQRGSTPVVAALSPVPVAVTRPSSALSPARASREPIGPVGDAGTPQIVSIPELAEKHLIGHSSVKESQIGCSGLTGARLIQVTEPISDHRHPNAEEMLYVVAGEAALTLGGKTETVKSGWFSIIPRGVPYVLIRSGRNPVILLSVLGSQPCGPMPTRAAAEVESVARNR